MPDRASRFAVIAAAASVGHLIGDYGAQTDTQATAKAAPGYNPPGAPAGRWRGWLANQAHCATYHAALVATVAAACAATGVRVRPGRAAAAVGISWGTHALIDRRWPVEAFMRATGSGPHYPAGAPEVDQMLHRASLLAAALVAAD